jgi:hypothetical protein
MKSDVDDLTIDMFGGKPFTETAKKPQKKALSGLKAKPSTGCIPWRSNVNK